MKETQKTVLVTGATGCVGSLVVEELLAAGHRVVATDRPGSALPPQHDRLRFVTTDLTDEKQVRSLPEGVDAVIHTAAWVDIAAPFEMQAPINLHAVRFLHKAAQEHAVSYFLHLSTGSIYAPKDGPITEDDPLLPTSGYERAKLLAEDYLRSQGEPPRINILRPTLIYGPRGKVLLAPLATVPALLAPVGRVPRLCGGPRFNVVHALDVARAAIHLLEREQPHLATFNVAAPEVLTGGELFEIAFRAGGLKLTDLAIPYPDRFVKAIVPLLRFQAPFAAFNRVLQSLWRTVTKGKALSDALPPRIDMEATAYLGGDTIFDASRLLSTGFEFRYPTFEEGWRQTLEWYEEHRWIPPREEPQRLRRAA